MSFETTKVSADHDTLGCERIDCVECLKIRVAYLAAQEDLLEAAQQKAAALEADIAAIQRPLDAQMARLNKNLIAANERIEQLEALLNSPIVDDFIQAVPIEAAHQQERWSTDHDAGKAPDDWLWLVAYLCTKASQAARYGDTEKHRHHIITAGAALLNWHRHATGELTAMRPGVDPEKAEARAHG